MEESGADGARELLIVEDERNLRALMGDLVARDGLVVTACETIAEAERVLAHHAPDLMILDVKLPDGDGLDLLDRVRARGLSTPAIVVTAFGTVDRAVHALRAGACDFLVKPFDNVRLSSAVAAALESQAKLEEVELRAGVVRDASELSRTLIGASGGLREVALLLRRVASSDATVLIQGESGTGKQLVARAIHDASPRMDGPFVALDCSAIAPTLLESELFGFERGAFTGAHATRRGHVESAECGTLFLDEIGDMPLEAQSRLLRVIQEREILRVGGRTPVKVDVRIVAATHRDLAALVAAGRFRQDLLYRLDVVPIVLPPLRERREDLAGLFEHFVEKHARRHKAPVLRPTPEILARAYLYSWPGNVRELENFVERSVVLGWFDEGALVDRPSRAGTPARADAPSVAPREASSPTEGERPATLREAVARAERDAVVAALRYAKGNKAEAARILGVSYKTLFNKIHEHDIREAITIA
ncbi:sigma-54 dependent transcriptional regulator [Myxococcota bacterium]|nr:sigma-54 dependent transcriptional regulator [Myxococcota bacterium]